jgi:predicted  nucleic acid-binding Zn-ribbon protein
MANPIVQQINAELETLQNELTQFKSSVAYLNGAKAHVKEAVASVNHAEAHFNKKIEELKNTYNAFIKLTEEVNRIVSKIDTINFPERLDGIENTISETIAILNDTKKSTLDELKKASQIIVKADFDGRFKKLQNAVDSSVSANVEVAKTIEKQKLPEKIDEFILSVNKKLYTSFSELQKNSKQFASETAKSILSLNIPVRMDKLDANIAGILSAIQNVQSRIESVDRNMADKLKETNEKQAATLKSLEDKINQNNATMQSQMVALAKKQQTNAYITWAIVILGTLAISILGKF